ncbi:MAG: hypothetical protein P8170_05105 [Gemmatimonadota bacterium]|jgi:hypothetical protein
MLALKILGAVLALAVGIWLGMPARYSQTTDDLERTMDSGLGRTRKVKRHFTPFAWMQRKAPVRSRRPQMRRGFHLESPEDD